MDNAALRLVLALENATPETPAARKEIMEIFAMADRWLTRRQKLQPEEQSDEGVNLLKQMLQDPREVVFRLKDDPAFVAALEKIGWLRPPEKLIGRPTAAQKVQREEYATEKDRRYGDAPPAAEDASGWEKFGIKGT